MHPSLRFENVELRPAARQLLIGGVEAHVGGRAFDMLVALVERRGRVVSKDELLDLVWPGLVVEENNLQAQVSALRKLIDPRAIATIPGRGYRFDASVESIDVDAEPAEAAAGPAHLAPVPSLPTAIVGRDEAIAALAELCSTRPLVTLVGPGGIGKTRLAQAFAARHRERFAGGIVWADLAVVSDSALVPAALAAALGITLVPHVDAFETMRAALRGRPLLVLVDNAEHLAAAVARAVPQLMEAGPLLRVLVTSQQPLKIAAEQVCRVAPLDVPEWPCTLETAAAAGAVALFVQRARAADRRFRLGDDNLADVVRICQRLDGMPLALELAAVRVSLLGTAGLLSHLDARFELLTGGERGAPSRQQTLRAALDWSFDLLDDRERTVLRRAAVFVGGFDLDAAQAVLADEAADPWAVLDALGTLVDRSFVSAGPGAQPRYSMPETARSYALGKLREAGELDTLRCRHAEATCRLIDRAYDEFLDLSDDAFVARYGPELDNFRAAMAWARDHAPLLYVSMSGAAVPMLRHRSLIREGFEYLEVAGSLVDDAMPLAVRARYALGAAMLGGSRDAAERAVALCAAGGDARSHYRALYYLSGRHDVTTATIEACVEAAHRLEDPCWPAKLLALGRAMERDLLYRQGRHAEALASLERCVVQCEAAGATDSVTSVLMYRVLAMYAAGDVAGAVESGLAVIERCRRLNNSYRLACMEASTFTAMLLLDEARHDEAVALASDFATHDRALGWPHVYDAADGLCLVAAQEGRIEDAAVLVGYADALHRSGQIARDAISAAAQERVQRRVAAALSEPRRIDLIAEGRILQPESAARLALRSWRA